MLTIGAIALVISMIFAPCAGQGSREPKERRVQKPSAKVDFTCRSQVDQTSDHEFTLNHLIKNNSSTPLSVEWKEAGIICVGMGQLPPGYTDSGSSGRVVQAPALVDSDIRYGAKLDYRAPAQVYIDPQKISSKKKIIETNYERKNEQDEPVFSIQVISELKEDQSAELTFRITGGLYLLLAADAPREVVNDLMRGFVEPSRFGFNTPSVDKAMRGWFDLGDGGRFLVLKNPTPETIEVTTSFKRGTPQGDLTLKEIHLVAFKPNEEGFVGLAALAYVPTNLPVK